MAAGIAKQVAEAVMLASSPSSSCEVRNRAARYTDELRNGDIALSVSTAMLLVDPAASLEVQHCGYAILHHLVKARWQSFQQADQQRMAEMAWGWLQQASKKGTPWVIRSKCALLMAEVARQSGGHVWESLLPALVQLAAETPESAVSAVMVIRHVTEDVTVYADDLQGEQKRMLLNSLNATVPQILPFIVQMLEQHFTAGAAAAARGSGEEEAERHSAVIQEGIEAAAVCSGVMPINSLLSHRLLDAAAFLLRTPEFNLQALDVLRKAVSRKVGHDEKEAFAAAASALMAAAAPLLSDPAAYAELGSDGEHGEFGLRLCETMAEFGTAHLEVLLQPSPRIEFMQQMLGFAQHPDPILSGAALTMWNSIMGKVIAARKGGSQDAAAQPSLPEGIIRLLVEAVPGPMTTVVRVDTVPSMFMSLKEFKEFSSTYRAKLSKLLKDSAALQPDTVLDVCGKQLSKAMASRWNVDMEVANVMLEAATSAFPADWLASSSSVGVTSILRALIDMNPSQDPVFAGLHGRCIEAMAPCLKYHGELMQEVVSKLISMLLAMPLMGGDGWALPPVNPPPGWKDAFSARVKLAGNVLGIGKVAGEQMVPHLQALSSHIQQLWQQKELRLGERNVLNEALLAAASGMGFDVQSQLLEWLLQPIRESWAQPARLHSVSGLQPFLREFADLPVVDRAQREAPIGGRLARWLLYHEVQLVERALRRMPPSVMAEQQQQQQQHPFLPHIGWAFAVPLQLLNCVQSTWQPEGKAALAAVGAESALDMSPAEKQVYLGQIPGRHAREAAGDAGSEESVAGGSATALRMWLKAIRDSVYLVVAMAVEHVPGLFNHLPLAQQMASGLLANLEHMEARHLRLLLRHAVVPPVRDCPQSAWGTWLPLLLPPLLPLLGRRLIGYWGAFDVDAALGASEDTTRAQNEVVEERIMRELSREAAVMVQVLAGMQRSAFSPQALPPKQVEAPGALVKGSILEWMIRTMPAAAQAVVEMAVASVSWPDADAAHRGMTVCRAVVGLAVDGHPELQQIVGGEMLRSAIHGLTLSSNTVFQGELITLIREILVRTLPGSPATRAVLLSLPGLDEAALARFHGTFAAEASEKEQRLIIKRLLVELGGEQLKALEEWRSAGAGASGMPLKASRATAGGRQQQGDGFELAVDWSDISNPTINN